MMLTQKNVAKFWARVAHARAADCWAWLGTIHNRYGYFAFRCAGKDNSERAHRVAYEIAREPIPDGLQVCHRCDNPACVNPGHLFVGTQADNMADKTAKGRQVRGVPCSGRAKLTSAQVEAIKERYATSGLTQAQIGEEYGVDQSTISKCTTGRNRYYPEMLGGCTNSV